MKTAKIILTLLIIVLILPAMTWAGPKVIKYSHFQPAKLDQPKQAAALAFKNYVESNTKGSVKVETLNPTPRARSKWKYILPASWATPSRCSRA
jgi:TRAP-type C4-dicarboxylate transport system substrate-binding protein